MYRSVGILRKHCACICVVHVRERREKWWPGPENRVPIYKREYACDRYVATTPWIPLPFRALLKFYHVLWLTNFSKIIKGESFPFGKLKTKYCFFLFCLVLSILKKVYKQIVWYTFCVPIYIFIIIMLMREVIQFIRFH